jgi:hypothetical protein
MTAINYTLSAGDGEEKTSNAGFTDVVFAEVPRLAPEKSPTVNFLLHIPTSDAVLNRYMAKCTVAHHITRCLLWRSHMEDTHVASLGQKPAKCVALYHPRGV